MIKGLIILHEKYIKNNNYNFSKKQIKVMDTISKNYNQLTNAQLCIKTSYIFNYHYEPKLIKQILSTYDDPIRAFVLFKKSTSNILKKEKKNSFSFSFKKTPFFEYLILFPSFIIGIALLGITLVYLFINFNHLHELLNINNLTKLIYPLVGFTMVIPFINIQLSEIYSKKFLNLKINSK